MVANFKEILQGLLNSMQGKAIAREFRKTLSLNKQGLDSWIPDTTDKFEPKLENVSTYKAIMSHSSSLQCKMIYFPTPLQPR